MPGKDFIPKNYSTGDKFTAADETEVQRELNEQEEYDVTQDAALAALQTLVSAIQADNNDDVEPADLAAAVATMSAAIAAKLDKLTGNAVLYSNSAAGVPATIPYTEAATANTVARRGTDGTLTAATATAAIHLTTKGQIDTALNTKADVLIAGANKLLRTAMLSLDPASLDFMLLPMVFNDLAFNTSRPGGSVSSTKNGSANTVNNIDSVFAPDATFTYEAIAAATDVYVITVAVATAISITWNSSIGAVFSSTYYPKDVKIEAYWGGAWNTVYDVTGQTFNTHKAFVSANNGVAITQLRYTFKNWNRVDSVGCRIQSLFAVPFDSKLFAAGFLTRAGGDLYGPIRHRGYTTAGRPSAAAVGDGTQIWDSTLKRPVWSDGTNWRDAAGNVV